jgi:hypothetical protein
MKGNGILNKWRIIVASPSKAIDLDTFHFLQIIILNFDLPHQFFYLAPTSGWGVQDFMDMIIGVFWISKWAC